MGTEEQIRSSLEKLHKSRLLHIKKAGITWLCLLFFTSIKILLYFRSDEGGPLWIFVLILKLSGLESAFAGSIYEWLCRWNLHPV